MHFDHEAPEAYVAFPLVMSIIGARSPAPDFWVYPPWLRGGPGCESITSQWAVEGGEARAFVRVTSASPAKNRVFARLVVEVEKEPQRKDHHQLMKCPGLCDRCRHDLYGVCLDPLRQAATNSGQKQKFSIQVAKPRTETNSNDRISLNTNLS